MHRSSVFLKFTFLIGSEDSTMYADPLRTKRTYCMFIYVVRTTNESKRKRKKEGMTGCNIKPNKLKRYGKVLLKCSSLKGLERDKNNYNKNQKY